MTTNPKTPPADAVNEPASPSLIITEIYASIQGESTWAGLPCVFVRLTGCPLRCVWCDTAYAFTGGSKMTIDEITQEVAGHGVGLVEVTGGEPLAQPECPELLAALCDAGHDVLLETSGSIDLSGLDERVVRIMDIKCPGSGEVERNRWENLELLGPRDEIKFVLADRADYEWARGVVHERGLDQRDGILFSPVHEGIDPADLAAWIIEDRLPVRLQIQLHKRLWPAAKRGV